MMVAELVAHARREHRLHACADLCRRPHGVLCVQVRVSRRIDGHIGSRAQVRQRLLNLHEKVEDGRASDEEKSRLLYMLRCIEWQAGGLNRRDPGFFEDDGSAESGSDGELVHVIDITIAMTRLRT